MDQSTREYLDKKIDDLEEKMTTRLTSLDHSIRGNGKPGIMTRLALLEKDNTSRIWRDRAVTAAALSLTGGVLIVLLKLAF